MKAYDDIDWTKVKRHLENYQAINALDQLNFISKEETDQLLEDCENKIESLFVEN